mmetsp:Transcript_20181/g.43975  ORF Transcript_20181/g.43975 Transcript_20181/m.43975 type:complete len:205 (-) Transcript_20181:1476-2090(-)
MPSDRAAVALPALAAAPGGTSLSRFSRSSSAPSISVPAAAISPLPQPPALGAPPTGGRTGASGGLAASPPAALRPVRLKDLPLPCPSTSSTTSSSWLSCLPRPGFACKLPWEPSPLPNGFPLLPLGASRSCLLLLVGLGMSRMRYALCRLAQGSGAAAASEAAAAAELEDVGSGPCASPLLCNRLAPISDALSPLCGEIALLIG